ncbi:MAG: hypothetical protein R3F59_05095 [Myxococcota bacterium]
MKFTPIADPLAGERTAAVVPTPAPLVQTHWSRPRYVTGRAVADTALSAEQQLRMGVATLLGQAMQPGVVHGLEATAVAAGIEVAPGLGLCGTGEDVVVAAPTRLDPGGLLVRGAEAVLGGDPGDQPLADVLAAVTGRQPGLPGAEPPAALAGRDVAVDSAYRAAADDVPADLVAARAKLQQERGQPDEEAWRSALDRVVRQLRVGRRLGDAALDVVAAQYADLAGEGAVRQAVEDVIRVYGDAGSSPRREGRRDARAGRRRPAVAHRRAAPGGGGEARGERHRGRHRRGDAAPRRRGGAARRRRGPGARRGAGAHRRPAADGARAARRPRRRHAGGGDGRGLGAGLARAARPLGRGRGRRRAPARGRSDREDVRARTVEELALAVLDGQLTLEALAESDAEVPVPGADLLPPVAVVLVAEPAYVDDLGAAGAPTDPCERDPDAEPFQDWRYVDAAAFAWVPVEAWLAEALPATDPADWWAEVVAGADGADALRNRLAWALFALERTSMPPWPAAPSRWRCVRSLPTGAAVPRPRRSRAPGRAPRRGRRRLAVPGAGRSAQWQAQLEQLQEQLADLPLAADTRLADTFRWLRRAACSRWACSTWPPARPTPRRPAGGSTPRRCRSKQLEAGMRSAASLAPSTSQSSRATSSSCCSPWGRTSGTPGLLRVQSVAEDFWAALRDARGRVDERLAATAELQAKIDALYRAVGGIDALPVRAEDDGSDGDAGRIAAAILWRNDAALAEIAAAEADTDGPLSHDEAVEALVAAALGDGPDAVALAAAFAGVRQPRSGSDVPALQSRNGPVVVVPAAPDGAVATVSGPGMALAGGWSHARAAPDDPFPAWVAGPVVYLVRGEADTEAVDRAVALAGEAPLVVLCTGLGAAAREEMDWRYVRADAAPAPLVVVLPLDPEADADRLDDLAARCAMGDAPDTPAPGREQVAAAGTVGGVAATATQVVLVDVPSPASAVEPRITALVATLPTLGGEEAPAYQRALARIRSLVTEAAVSLVPDVQRGDGTRQAAHARAVAALVDAVHAAVAEADDASVLTANELLAHVAAEATWGTTPAPIGWSVELVDDLLARLQALRSPRSDAPVLADEELNLVLGADDVVGVGLGGFAAVLEEKANRADDAVDFAFVRVQAAIFRLRQHMTGREKATRMASSPILAEVADLIVPDATPTRLGLFFDALQKGRGAAPTGGGGGGGGTPTVTPSGIVPEITDERLFDILGGIDPSDPVSDWTSGGKLDTVELALAATELAEPVFEPAIDPVRKQPGTGVLLGDRAQPRPDLTRGTPLTQPAGGIRTRPTVRDLGIGRLQAGADVGEAQATATVTAQAASYDAYSVPLLAYTAPAVTASTTYSVARVVDSISYVQALRPVEFVVRSTGIATRLEESQAAEITREAYALRASVTQTLATLELNLAGVPMSLLILRPDKETGTIMAAIEWHALDAEDDTVEPDATGKRPTFAETILAGLHDPKTTDADEAALFSDATRNLEAVAGMLRVVEAQVRLVREAIETARRARTVLLQLVAQAEAREQALAEALAEARQDLFATAALLTEEQERADEINTRRARVLAEAVPFLAFHRVRAVSLDDAPPVHDLAPTLATDPAVEALNHPAPPAPRELAQAVALLRSAPARWLVAVAAALPRIDRADALRRTLEASRARALSALLVPVAAAPSLVGLRGLDAVSGLTANRALALTAARQPAAALRLEAVSRLTWQQGQSVARTVLSVGDLADGSVPAVARAAAEELDRIHTVAAALYQELSQVAPRIRAKWVDRIGQYDRPLSLRDLSVLPDWARVGTDPTRPDPFRKRELQALVDWLYARVVPEEADAGALIDDLVRIAVLLASHAPVGRILAGLVDVATPVTPGAKVGVTVDAEKLRVGMTALVLAGSAVRARAVVEDLGIGRVTARIVSPAQSGVVLQPGDTVRFVESDGVVLPEGDAAQPAAARPLAQLVDPPVLRAWLAR